MPGPPLARHCTCGMRNCGYGRIMARTTPLGAVARGMLAGAAGMLAMDALLPLLYRRAGGEERSLPGGRLPPSRTGRTLRLRPRPAAGRWRACSRVRCPPGGPGRSATPPPGRTAHARVRGTARSPDRRRGGGSATASRSVPPCGRPTASSCRRPASTVLPHRSPYPFPGAATARATTPRGPLCPWTIPLRRAAYGSV